MVCFIFIFLSKKITLTITTSISPTLSLIPNPTPGGLSDYSISSWLLCGQKPNVRYLNRSVRVKKSFGGWWWWGCLSDFSISSWPWFGQKATVTDLARPVRVKARAKELDNIFTQAK